MKPNTCATCAWADFPHKTKHAIPRPNPNRMGVCFWVPTVTILPLTMDGKYALTGFSALKVRADHGRVYPYWSGCPCWKALPGGVV